MEFAVYATFEQMHGRKSTLAELVQRLKPFSRTSVLYTCAVTGMTLRIWDGTNWERSNYDLFLATAFDELRGDWYRLSARTDKPELVVHRRQLLLIAKLALDSCPENGNDLFSAPPGYFGTILLMANDQFHYGLFPGVGTGAVTEAEKVARVLAEFVPVTEFGGARIENRIVRAHLMMTKHTHELARHPDFVDVAAINQELTGISLEDHEALTFGVFSRCNMVTLQRLQQNPWIAVLQEKDFHTTAISRETIHAFFSELSSRQSELKLEIERGRRTGRDYGANDFTLFRKKPLIAAGDAMLPADIPFVIEKFATGPYWRANVGHGDQLRRFWGAVFEAYTNDQLAEAAKRSGALFLPDPRWANNPAAQVCDSILIEGDTAVLLEYKSSMFTARAKYSGNHEILRDEIVIKLVRNENTKKKKGVQQLAVAVKRLLGRDPSAAAVEGADLSNVSRIYPLLVTLDDIGATLLMSRFLQGYFKAALRDASLSAEKAKPLFCTDIESLELLLPFSASCPLSKFLQHWLETDPMLLSTLLARVPEGLPPTRNDILYHGWDQLSGQIAARLFPNEPLGPAKSNRDVLRTEYPHP
jgi:hypothetical protein